MTKGQKISEYRKHLFATPYGEKLKKKLSDDMKKWHQTPAGKNHKKKMSRGMKRWLKSRWNCSLIERKHIPLLGTMMDKDLAARIGVTKQAVHALRKKLNIPSFMSRNGKLVRPPRIERGSVG